VVSWIEKHLGRAYTWPGNFRELEQCVRSYTIRKEYRPIPRTVPAADRVGAACEVLAESVNGRDITWTEIERCLFARVHERTGSYQEAARLLGVDWRTLRARVNSGRKTR
jgi:DNA-binding NtrC family response regulator